MNVLRKIEPSPDIAEIQVCEIACDYRIESRVLSGEIRGVDVHVMVQVWPIIAGGVRARRPNVTRVRITKDLDEPVFVIPLFVGGIGGELFHAVLVAAQILAEGVGMIEEGDRVVQGLERALINLIEVGLAQTDLGGINVEGHDSGCDTQRIQSRIGLVHLGLNRTVLSGDLVHFGDGGAVDLLDADMVGVGIGRGKNRVGDDPVEDCTAASAARPFIETPGALGIGVLVSLPLPGWIFDVFDPVGEVDNFSADFRLGCGGTGKFPLVKVIHADGGPGDEHEFRLGHPIVKRMAQQAVVFLDGGEIMAPGVAMTLRI